MARQGIGTGSSPNDGTGDNLRSAGGKINDNFIDVYNYFGNGTTLSSGTWDIVSSGINTLSSVGIGTTNPRFTLEVGAVGASGTSLYVNGDARVTGILTVGSSSVTLNGSTNEITVGTGITISGNTGIISATQVTIAGETLTGAGVTSLVAGSNITLSGSTGQVTISSSGGGGITTANINADTLNVSGISTLGVTSVTNLTLQQLNVSGSSTFTGLIDANGGITATTGTFEDLIGAGAIVFSTGSGKLDDHANLSYTSASSTLNVANLDVSNDVDIDGHTELDNVNVSGALTATTGTFENIGSTHVVFGGVGGKLEDSANFSYTQGTATLDVVKLDADAIEVGTAVTISAGIITAATASGIVTYYGDGSKLTGVSGGGGITVQDEGSALSTTATTLNFIGSSVVASGTGATKTITVSGVGGITVQDEGSALSTTATTLNFVGSGVVASGTGATKTITISGGGGGGGISTSRANVSGTTGSVGAAATTDLSITAFKSYGILKVGISSAAWVRLYVDAASRTSDSSRSYLVDPTAGSGLIAEVRTETAGISTFLMTPGVIGWNNDSTPASTIYAAVTNNESSTAAITVTLSVVKLED